MIIYAHFGIALAGIGSKVVVRELIHYFVPFLDIVYIPQPFAVKSLSTVFLYIANWVFYLAVDFLLDLIFTSGVIAVFRLSVFLRGQPSF